MNIDWTDKRAIGLKCWFSEPPKPEEYRDNFIGMVQGGRFLAFMNTAFSNCRIAQGEKTPYDGKSQPVPDGVLVTLWLDNGCYLDVPQRAEGIEWLINVDNVKIAHYQVQAEK